jgi:hypothetical protein
LEADRDPVIGVPPPQATARKPAVSATHESLFVIIVFSPA